jgi:hypothetical protein
MPSNEDIKNIADKIDQLESSVKELSDKIDTFAMEIISLREEMSPPLEIPSFPSARNLMKSSSRGVEGESEPIDVEESMKPEDIFEQMRNSVEKVNSELKREDVSHQFEVTDLDAEIKTVNRIRSGVLHTTTPSAQLGPEAVSTIRFSLKPTSPVVKFVDEPEKKPKKK